MKIKSIYTRLITLFPFSEYRSNDIDPELEGTWAFECPTETMKSLTFKGELFGLNGDTLNIKRGENRVKFAYIVDNDNVPNKLYTIIYTLNNKLKTPYGIYKINGDKMTICYAEKKQKMLHGKPVGRPKEEFPDFFTNKCVNLKRVHPNKPVGRVKSTTATNR